MTDYSNRNRSSFSGHRKTLGVENDEEAKSLHRSRRLLSASLSSVAVLFRSMSGSSTNDTLID